MLARFKASQLISNAFRASSLLVIDPQNKDNNHHIHIHQHHEYMTGPLVAVAGVTASAFGTYWALRAHFNPIKSRPLSELMNTNMIGQVINSPDIDIKLNPLNTELQSEITKMREDTIKKIRMRFQFQFLTGNLYLRPILFDDTDAMNQDIDTIKLFKEYGICHAFWILNAGPVDYILDFVREGIRFEMIENAQETIKEYPDVYIPCFPANVSLNISSHNLIDWIEEQGKVSMKYDLNGNHCLNFVDRFGQHFKPEIFHNEIAATNKMSKFNTGIDEKSNDELLKWTKSIIDSNGK